VLDYDSYGEMLNDIHTSQAFQEHFSHKERAARRALDEYARKLQKAIPSAILSQEVLAGMPKEVILEVAETWGADMIVMGSHARKGLSRFLLGSVSMSVLSHSPCSVIIVKLPQSDKTAGGSARTTMAAAS
jgi:nucleotide-binding universal stress UspA family protein